MTLRKVSPGQAFRPLASTWNQFVDAANAHAAQSGPGFSSGLHPWQGREMVWVLNNTSQMVGQYSPVWLSGLQGVAPSGTSWTPDEASLAVFGLGLPDDNLPLAILQQSLAPGEVGRAVVSGISVATAYVRHPGQRYVRYLGTSYAPRVLLSTDTWGHGRILQGGDSAGVKPCVILLGDYTASRPCACYAVSGSSISVRVSGRRIYHGLVEEEFTADYAFAVGSTSTHLIAFVSRGDVAATGPLVWVPVDGYATPTASDTTTAGRQRDPRFAGTLTGVYGHGSDILCVLRVASRSSLSDPLRVDWTVFPPNRFEHRLSQSPIRYDETTRMLGWYGVVENSSVAVPAGTSAYIYAAGQWGFVPSIVLDGTGYDWSQAIGRIITDAAGKVILFEHENADASAMVRYVFTGA